MQTGNRITLDEITLAGLKTWFESYVRTFQGDEPQTTPHVQLKICHTRRVCEEIRHLGEQLHLDADELRLAEIIALFHDIGRFEQYARHKTFVDHLSENHAELGIRILEENGIFDAFEPYTGWIVRSAIKHHNRPRLPENEAADFAFYQQLIRDADKLDIWRLVTAYYTCAKPRSNSLVELNLPDSTGISPEVRDALVNGRIVNIQHVRNLNDLKLLQAGWVFDINFEPTRACVRDRGYLETLQSVLPQSIDIEAIFSHIRSTLSTLEQSKGVLPH